MAYLGNIPARSFISFERQVFTIVNSQTAYTLDHSVTNENDIRLVINNVVQEPGSGKAYTASGTTLTLSAALTNGTDEMYCVFLGKAVGTVNAPAGSVSTSQLVDLNVTTAKIAADAVTPPKTNFFNTDPGNAADLGNLHVKTGDSGVTSLSVSHDELVVESDGNAGISILGGGSNTVGVAFGDSADSDIGRINYVHSDNSMRFINNASENARIDSSGDLLFNSGYGSATTAFGVRAWVKFNGTGTIAITASGNVSSLSDNGTGDYAITFTNALVDANYAHFANSVKGGGAPTSSNSGVGFGIENRTVNGFGVAVGQLDGTIVDRSEVFGCVIR